MFLPFVYHWFFCKTHAFFDFYTSSSFSIMEHLWFFMIDLSDAMTAIIFNNRIMIFFCMFLDDCTNIPKMGSWFYNIYGFVQTFLSNFHKSFVMGLSFTDQEHFRSIAMPSIPNHSYIYV